MKNKKIVKMIIDSLMLIIMLLEFSKLYTGQLLHEIFGIALFVLFIIHNILNINFYKNILKGNYNLLRIITTTINILFLICMLLTILLGIPISSELFKGLNLNGNMTVRKLHTILGYWNLILLSIHLGFHFKLIIAKLKNKIKGKKVINLVIYLVEIIIVIFGIKTMIDVNLGEYLIGASSFAIRTSMIQSILNNFIIILSNSIITYNFEKLLLKKENNKWKTRYC